MAATLQQIIEDAMNVIGEVSGSGTQTYSEDRMKADAIRAFDYLFKKFYWPQFLEWSELSLNGTTGKITTNAFPYLRDFEDIFVIFRAGENSPLPKLNRLRNPFTISGTRVQFWDALPVTDTEYQHKRIQFWPKAATGDVVTGARIYPRIFEADGVMEPWALDHFMDLDKNMLVQATAWATLSSDDLNSGAAQDQMNLMEGRFNDITKDMASKRIKVDGISGVPLDWYQSYPL